MEKVNTDLQKYERIPTETRHARGFNPRTYKSIQDRVNNDPEYEAEYINKLINEEWVKLADPKELLNPAMRGRHFKYRLNGKGLSNAGRGTFRSGGIVVGKKDSDDYIMYKAFNGCLFPLQIADILEVYMKDPNKKIERKTKELQPNTIVYFKEPGRPTNYPIYLPSNLTGENILVKYARDTVEKRQFTSSTKFLHAQKTGNWKFAQNM